MRIKNIEIQNFKCVGPDPIKLDFSDNILVLIGENNVGKSAVIKALYYYFSGIKTIPTEYFHNKQTDVIHAINIKITFDSLTEEDKCHQAVSSYITTDGDTEMWILKKLYYCEEDGRNKCDYIAEVNGNEKRNPGGWSQNCDDLFTNEKMQKIFVEPVKDVDEVSDGAGKSVFGQIFNLLIKESLQSTPEYENLSDSLENYQNLFSGSTQLPKVLEIEDLINTKLARIFTATSKIKADSPKPDKILPIPELLTNDGRIIDVKPIDQGHGLQRSIIFTLLEILAETSSPVNKPLGPKNLLLVEEPEIYMHPQMERRIADTLYEIAESGSAQVICTTHSPIFIRIADKQKALVRLVRKTNNSLKVIQKKTEIFEGNDKDHKRRKIRMLANFDPTVNEAFFAKRVVLVEGDTEIAIFREAAQLLPSYFDTNDKKHKIRDTTFINCRGKWTIAAFQEVLNHFDVEYIVIHDSDLPNNDSGANNRILELLGGDESKRKVFQSKIEDVLGLVNVDSKDKPLKALKQVYELASQSRLESMFGDYFKFAYGL
jgi:putative ATP-dependent endonuclease of OLD family